MIAALVALLLAQSPAPPAVAWTLRAPEARAGETIELTLSAVIAPGWHLYAMTQPEGGPVPTEFSVPAGQPVRFAKPVIASKPATIHDPNFDLRIQLYSGTATFRLPVRVDPSTPAGPQAVVVHARYQSCNDLLCLPPRTVPIATTLIVRSR